MIEPRSLVADGVYRSGQPLPPDLSSFRGMGGATVLRVSSDGDIPPIVEGMAAQDYGLVYIYIPLPSFFGPGDSDIDRILSIIADPQTRPILIHCLHGEDRTGMIVACYRIKFDGWTADRALAEAKAHHMSWASFFLRAYIRRFARRIARVEST